MSTGRWGCILTAGPGRSRDLIVGQQQLYGRRGLCLLPRGAASALASSGSVPLSGKHAGFSSRSVCLLEGYSSTPLTSPGGREASLISWSLLRLRVET